MVFPKRMYLSCSFCSYIRKVLGLFIALVSILSMLSRSSGTLWGAENNCLDVQLQCYKDIQAYCLKGRGVVFHQQIEVSFLN